MEGLNYEFHCHHANRSIRTLAKEFTNFRGGSARELYHRAISVAKRALLYSDAPFLHAPGPIAFACVALATDAANDDGYMGRELENFLAVRCTSKSGALAFARQVRAVLCCLLESPGWETDRALRRVADLRRYRPTSPIPSPRKRPRASSPVRRAVTPTSG